MSWRDSWNLSSSWFALDRFSYFYCSGQLKLPPTVLEPGHPPSKRQCALLQAACRPPLVGRRMMKPTNSAGLAGDQPTICEHPGTLRSGTVAKTTQPCRAVDGRRELSPL